MGCSWFATNRVKTFKLSKDKRFEEKLTDVVGVYLNPPDKAVVLCVDEKTQVQALEQDTTRIADEERALWNNDA